MVVTLAAVVLEYLRTVYKHYMEISTTILMSLGLAVSLIIMSKSDNAGSMSLEQYLFGSIITISQEQVVALFVIAAIILVLTLLFIRPMYILTFDEDTAFVDGLPVRLMSILFSIVTEYCNCFDYSCGRRFVGIYDYGFTSQYCDENWKELQVGYFPRNYHWILLVW